MMMKNALLAVALASVALWAGCATGGGGHTGGDITVKVSSASGNQVAVTLTAQLTAEVKNTDNHSVTWTLTQSGTACSPGCGTLSSSGLFTAPATIPVTPQVDATATSVANPKASDTFQIIVVGITVSVTPGPATVGVGLEQQFSAPILPDSAPQTVTWGPITGANCPANDCGVVDANGVYTAPNAIPAEVPFLLPATSSVQFPSWIGTAKVTVVTSRLSGHYAFRFSGYDNADKPVAIAGAFLANSDGSIASGVQDELTASGHKNCSILASSGYAFTSSNGTTHNSNDHGTLTLKTSGCAINSRSFNFLLSADGNGRLIEFGDGAGRGTGKLSVATASSFNNAALTGGFAFGLSGANSLASHRAGSAGFFVADGKGTIGPTAGALDINDGGVITSTVNVTGTYNINSSDGSGTMSLVDNTAGVTYQFAIYMVGGKTANATNPLTLYMISTDPLANHPSVSGTIVFQDKTQAFGNSALNNISVTNLTGVVSGGTQVSLTSASGDGNGNIAGAYDANNAGTILAATKFSSTYAAKGGGRYTVDWLSPAVHFVLYLSAANRGFMLEIDPKTPNEVYTGTMDPQGSGFATSAMVGVVDAVTDTSASPVANQIAMSMFNTFGSLTTFTVAGAQDQTTPPAGQTLAGTGTMNPDTSVFTVTLTQPASAKYVLYAIDDPKPAFLIQHFEMIDVDTTNADPTIILGER